MIIRKTYNWDFAQEYHFDFPQTHILEEIDKLYE